MNPLARLEVEQRDGAVVAHVEGDIDLSNAHELRGALESAAPADAVGLVIDLSDTGYLDSSGVAVLIGVARELSVRRQRLAIVAPPGSAVSRVLTIVQIGQIAGLHDSVDDAAAALGAP